MKSVENTQFQLIKSSLPKKAIRAKPIIYHGNFFRSLFLKKGQICAPSTQRTCIEKLFLAQFFAGKSESWAKENAGIVPRVSYYYRLYRRLMTYYDY